MLFSFSSKVAFSTSKNYTSQFKVRNRLAQFFKHIHPDQMAQAPTKIKQENLRSLKNFNSYFDAINQERPIEGKLLKFYISEKSNNKSRKFFSFNLELPELNAEQAKMTEKKAEKLIDDIVNAINTKYKQSRSILQGKKKEKIVIQEEIKIETQQQKTKRMQETQGPFIRSSYKRYIEQESLKSAINSKFMETEKQNLKLKLRQNMSFANTSTNKPMMWSRIMMGESGIYNDYQAILNNLIDPKLIYFSEDIGLPEIQQFKKKLLPGQLDRLGVRATQAVLQVCQEMESFSPPIFLYVTTHYSATQIPGFFSIPFDFVPQDLLQKFTQCKRKILEQREKYEQYYDLFKDMVKDLQKRNKIRVKTPAFKNNVDISSKILVLQRLAKYTFEKVTDLNIFDPEQHRIFCQEYKFDDKRTAICYKGKLFVTATFKDEDLGQLVDTSKNNQPSQSTSEQGI